MITDYSLLFIDDYSPIKDLVDSIFVHRWERAYSRGILEKRLENYDLVLLDLDTGNQLQRDTIDEIRSRVSKERFYLTVKKHSDEKKIGSRIKEWNAGGYLVMPFEHEHVAGILRWISLGGDSQLPFLNSRMK